MSRRPLGAGIGAALAAAGLPILIALLLLPRVAGAEGSRAPSDPDALELYDPLFDEEPEEGPGPENDPFERANRATFAFNQGVDRWLLDPLTRGYQWLVPGPARRGINRVMLNLNSPVSFANEVLQLRPEAAGATLGRFIANTTLGVAGIFDVAADQMGIPRKEADFGQTLACYGVPRGPYLMIPLFGPATLRDASGRIVDQALTPLNYLFSPLNLQWQIIRGGGQGLVLRDANMDAIDALRDASVDYYAALRSAYLQSRRAMELEVRWGERTAEAGSASELPAEAGARPEPGPDADPPGTPTGPMVDEPEEDQDSVPEASFSMRASMAAISPSKSSRLTMPENSERRSASSLTVPSR